MWPRLQRCWWEKKNRRVCIFYSLLCSLNGLFEGNDRSQKALGGGTAGSHLDSNSTTDCFFGGRAGVSEEVGFGLASKLWLLQRLKAAIEGGRAFQHLPKEDSPWELPSFSHQAVCWHTFWVEFHCGYFRRC